jgi:hypothetical protein
MSTQRERFHSTYTTSSHHHIAYTQRHTVSPRTSGKSPLASRTGFDGCQPSHHQLEFLALGRDSLKQFLRMPLILYIKLIIYADVLRWRRSVRVPWTRKIYRDDGGGAHKHIIQSSSIYKQLFNFLRSINTTLYVCAQASSRPEHIQCCVIWCECV